MTKTFCPLPWIHLATRPNGDIRLCCTSNASGANFLDNKEVGLVKENNTRLNLKTHSIEQVWNSEFLKTVRLQMLNNEIPASCKKCFEEESQGITSKRQWESKVWQERLDISSIVSATNPDGSLPVSIPYFDLRLGNTCQLKCIMCSPHDSSSWIKDWKTQYPTYKLESLRKDQQWDQTWDYNWYQRSEFLTTIKDQAANIKELYYADGEPTIIPEHYKILEFMIESGSASTCVIRYNSNGLELPEQLFELWNHFKEIKFNFSLDGIEERNDYIRYPSKWNSVLTSLERLDNTPDNVVVNIACAIQMLNVNHLPELVEWKMNKKFRKINKLPYGAGLIGLHLVYFPSYLNIKTLPIDVKQKVSKTLSTFIDSQTSNEFINNSYGKTRWEGIIKYMMSEDWSNKLPDTVEYLETCDRTRGTNFRQIFTELKDI